MAGIIRTRQGGTRIGVLTFFLGAVACSSGGSAVDQPSAASGGNGGAGSTGTGSGSSSGAVDDGTESDDGGDATISCANDPRAEAYAPNMAQAGNAGLLTFILASASPAPPALGNVNMWTLKVVDANGQAVPDATFSSITTWMPDHGHGSTPGISAPNGDGTYGISNLYFFMPGLWQITFNAQLAPVSDAAPTTDSATFTFCVGG